MLPHNLSNALEILITTHLLSSIQRLLPRNTLCFTLDQLDTYVLLYFLPALCIFERKGALDPPPPPLLPKKACLHGITTFFQVYCAKSEFLLEFSMIYFAKYKIKILCVSTIV